MQVLRSDLLFHSSALGKTQATSIIPMCSAKSDKLITRTNERTSRISSKSREGAGGGVVAGIHGVNLRMIFIISVFPLSKWGVTTCSRWKFELDWNAWSTCDWLQHETLSHLAVWFWQVGSQWGIMSFFPTGWLDHLFGGHLGSWKQYEYEFTGCVSLSKCRS